MLFVGDWIICKQRMSYYIQLDRLYLRFCFEFFRIPIYSATKSKVENTFDPNLRSLPLGYIDALGVSSFAVCTFARRAAVKKSSGSEKSAATPLSKLKVANDCTIHRHARRSSSSSGGGLCVDASLAYRGNELDLEPLFSLLPPVVALCVCI